MLLPLRHPSLVAREFASLDYLSGGRVVLGVGVGGEGGKDFEAVGRRPARARRADGRGDARACRPCSPGRRRRSPGRFFAFEGITIEPAGRPGGPPLWVGGRSAAARRRAGRLGDGWMPIWVSAEKFAAGLAEVRAHAQDAGRDPAAIAAAVVCPALLGDDAGPRLAAHLELRYGMTVEPHLVDRYCVAGSPEECAARVREYADAGAEHVIFNIGCAAGDELLDQAAALHTAASTTLQHSVAWNNASRLEVS